MNFSCSGKKVVFDGQETVRNPQNATGLTVIASALNQDELLQITIDMTGYGEGGVSGDKYASETVIGGAAGYAGALATGAGGPSAWGAAGVAAAGGLVLASLDSSEVSAHQAIQYQIKCVCLDGVKYIPSLISRSITKGPIATGDLYWRNY